VGRPTSVVGPPELTIPWRRPFRPPAEAVYPLGVRTRIENKPMMIAWNLFTPWAALAGGALIGLAVALLLLFNGRIAGISGVLGGLLGRPAGDMAWRVAFLAGLIGAPLLYGTLGTLPRPDIAAGNGALVVAGLLVGLGTRYGSGCTSGHGVCGLSRLSPRSLVATLAFMGAGFATVYVLRHLLAA
jgi:uncharacterized membrane protein YedE/YeeE